MKPAKIFARIWIEWIATPEIRGLGRNALLIWVALQAHAAGTHYADPKTEIIIEETGIEAKALSKGFRELEAAGLLTRALRQGFGKKGHKATIYTLHAPQSLENAPQVDAPAQVMTSITCEPAQVMTSITCEPAQVMEVITPPRQNLKNAANGDTLKKQACNSAKPNVSEDGTDQKRPLSDPFLNSHIKIPPTPQGGLYGSGSGSGYRSREQKRQDADAEVARRLEDREAERERRRLLRPRLAAEIKTWGLTVDEEFYLLYSDEESTPPYLQKRLEYWHAAQN